MAQPFHGLTGISNTFHLGWLDSLMPNLSYRAETAWWALAIQGENFWCFPLMTWLIFFQRPFTLGCGEGCLAEPLRALTSTYGRCEAENWWRQKPKKSIGPVSQWGGERLLKTQSRHVLAAWCASTAHLRTPLNFRFLFNLLASLFFKITSLLICLLLHI